MSKINVLSLFSGCGGMDLGFEGGFNVHRKSIPENSDFIEKTVRSNYVKLKKTPFKTVFANDILPEARVSWTNYFKRKCFRTESIVDLVKDHREGKKVFPRRVDIVTGGFPCQDFSNSGKRLGFESHKDHNGKLIEGEIATEETRGKLYMWMKEVIDITQPKIFIAENVKGLTNLADVKDIIQHDFSTAANGGYIVLTPKVLHAADYGVPQTRERVIFIGIKRSALKLEALAALEGNIVPPEFDPYPPATHSFTIKNDNLCSPVTLKDVFAGLKEPSESSDLSQKNYSKAKFMGRHCQGQKEVDLDGPGPTIRSEHHGNIEYRRLSEINEGKLSGELKRGKVERRLTPRECAIIQTFPNNYEFVRVDPKRKNRYILSASGAYKVIGNAVPPLLAYHIAKRIESLWDIYFKRDGNID